MKSLPLSVQLAVARARVVARFSLKRAIDLLVAAGVAFQAAVRFALSAATPKVLPC